MPARTYGLDVKESCGDLRMSRCISLSAVATHSWLAVDWNKIRLTDRLACMGRSFTRGSPGTWNRRWTLISMRTASRHEMYQNPVTKPGPNRAVGRLLEVGAATSKKHAPGREAAEKFISTSHGHSPKTWPRIYVHENYGCVDRAYSQKLRPGGSKTAWSGFCTDTECVELGKGVWGACFPGKFLENFVKLLWDDFRGLFLGLKTSLGSRRFRSWHSKQNSLHDHTSFA